MIYPSIYVIIPCAGVGSRFKNDLPKQYHLIDQHTILWHTLNAIISVDVIKSVWVIANSTGSYIDEYAAISSKIHIAKVGADTRSKSVLNGLLQLEDLVEADDWVLVHDAVRCCITPELISKLIAELYDDPVGGILAIKATDTVKQVKSTSNQPKIITQTIDRNAIYLAQTPQMFRYGILKNALLNSDLDLVTDEASAVEMSGKIVRIVEGDINNIKVTNPYDIKLARFILNNVSDSTYTMGGNNAACSSHQVVLQAADEFVPAGVDSYTLDSNHIYRINSKDNSLIKQIVKLTQNKNYRYEQGLAVIYGQHLVEEAFKHNILDSVLMLDASVAKNRQTTFPASVKKHIVSDSIMKKINVLDSVNDIVGIIRIQKVNTLCSNKPFAENCIILDNIQDPGNLGTILRTAMATGFKHVIISSNSVDVYNSKVLRASQGMQFGLSIYNFTNPADLTDFIAQYQGIVILTTPHTEQLIYGIDLKQKIALVFGNEGSGLSKQLLAINKSILAKIPMQVGAESLNVAMAATVCMFEAMRQRGKI